MLHLLFYISLQCCKIFQFDNKILLIFVGAGECCMVLFYISLQCAKSSSLIIKFCRYLLELVSVTSTFLH